MKGKALNRTIAWLALAAGLALAAMLVAALVHGTTAQAFEDFVDPAAYARSLLAFEGSIRTFITLDNLFLISYTGALLMLAIALKDENNRWLVAAAVGALLVTTYLDIHENNELLVFIQMAKAGFTPSVEMLHARALWSAVKFHSSYLSFFLIAFVLPQKTVLERFLRWSLWLGYVPIGILVYTFPNPWFALARYALMLGGLLILAWNFYLRSKK